MVNGFFISCVCVSHIMCLKIFKSIQHPEFSFWRLSNQDDENVSSTNLHEEIRWLPMAHLARFLAQFTQPFTLLNILYKAENVIMTRAMHKYKLIMKKLKAHLTQITN